MKDNGKITPKCDKCRKWNEKAYEEGMNPCSANSVSECPYLRSKMLKDDYKEQLDWDYRAHENPF